MNFVNTYFHECYFHGYESDGNYMHMFLLIPPLGDMTSIRKYKRVVTERYEKNRKFF